MSREISVSTIPLREPVVDQEDHITRIWERYFYDLWFRTGGPDDHVNGLYTDVAPNNSYTEITRISNLVSSVIIYTNPAKTQKIIEQLYTRTAGLVTSYLINYYNQRGNLFATETHTVTRTGGLVTSDGVMVT